MSKTIQLQLKVRGRGRGRAEKRNQQERVRFILNHFTIKHKLDIFSNLSIFTVTTQPRLDDKVLDRMKRYCYDRQIPEFQK